MAARRLSVATATVVLLLAAPDPSAAVKRRAFVTSVTGNANLSSWPGASGSTPHQRADSICRNRAQLAGLPNHAAYRAWLSTSTTDAYCHVQGLTGKKATGCGGAVLPGAGPWYLANGVSYFTGSLEDLVGPDRVIYRPVILDEHVQETDANVRIWTGTTASGQAIGSWCNDWTSSNSGQFAVIGAANHSARDWTELGVLSCDGLARLLCLETGPSEIPTPLAWNDGAIVFVTSGIGTGDLSSWPEAHGKSGLAAADEICREHARQAGVSFSESFVAWLGIPGDEAEERITVDAQFRRLDAFTIAGSRADLLDGSISNSLHVDELGRYIAHTPAVWTGTDSHGNVKTPNCSDWTSASSDEIGALGRASGARNGLWADAAFGYCHHPSRLFCFSNVVTVEPTLFDDGFETGTTSAWSATAP